MLINNVYKKKDRNLKVDDFPLAEDLHDTLKSLSDCVVVNFGSSDCEDFFKE